MKSCIQKQATNIEYRYFEKPGYNLFQVTVKGLSFYYTCNLTIIFPVS